MTPALSQQLDLYCERLGPGLWQEPLNLLSNLAFLLVGAWLFRYSRIHKNPLPMTLLAAALFMIGVGSLAFHAFANVWSQWLDVLFIAVFIYAFVPIYVRLRFHAPIWLALLCVPAYHLFGLVITSAFPNGAFHGSVDYFPAMATLPLLAVVSAFAPQSAGAKYFLVASLCFALSLTLRSNDMNWCASIPKGVHWAWHLLNAVTLGLSWWGLNLSVRTRTLAT